MLKMATQYELDRMYTRDYLNSKYVEQGKTVRKRSYVQFDETRKFIDRPKNRLNLVKPKINY